MIFKNYIKRIYYIIFFLFIFFNVLIARNSSLKEGIIVDWQKGFVVSRGEAHINFNDKGSPVDTLTGKEIPLNRARIEAYNSAKEAAVLNLAETIKHLRVDPYNSLLDIMKNSGNTQRLVSDRLSTSVTYKEFPVEFDSSFCEAKISFGRIIDSLSYDFPSNDFPVREEIPIETPYSGLIIDGRGLDIVPMLFPSIYSDAGLEIYGRNFIDSYYAIQGGVASYCYNENQAWSDIRAGEHPYFALAIKSINNCPVLSEKDARRVLSSQKTINNLKKCRVIFIIDRERRSE